MKHNKNIDLDSLGYSLVPEHVLFAKVVAQSLLKHEKDLAIVPMYYKDNRDKIYEVFAKDVPHRLKRGYVLVGVEDEL